MDAVRYVAKLYLAEAGMLDERAVVPVFHRWIQEGRLDELAIDVADYGHVRPGPGVVLICHEAHYALDATDGRVGLLYAKKRDASPPPADARPSPAERMRAALRKALAACALLEADASLAGRATFGGDELLLGIDDRLFSPNSPATFASLRPELESVVSELFAGAACTLEQLANPKACFRVRVRAPSPFDVTTLRGRLGP